MSTILERQARPVVMRCFDGLLTLALFATAVSTVLALFATHAWWLELFSHFRLQYLASQLLLSVPLLLCRRWRSCLLLLPLVALNAAATSAYWPREADAGGGASGLRIVTANLYTQVSEAARFMEQARRERPDLLVLVEFDHEWRAALTKLTSEYPYTLLEPRPGSFGIALLSRVPFREQRRFTLESSPALDVLLELPGGNELRLLAVHLRTPMSRALAAERNRQLDALGEIASRVEEPLVITGDFNITPYSPVFEDWAVRTGLRNAREGRGWAVTWPTFFPLLGIPIDHVVISEHFHVGQQRRGQPFGSDHYPIITELSLRGNP